MNSGRRRMFGPPMNNRKDRDEDLHLFREMHKREKERTISLLQPVSDEFDTNPPGNYPLYKIASTKKGFGNEFLAGSGKNDYDWLKTPPATPLFPSLEMEAIAPELAIQREIPIIHPLTRFSGKSDEASKATTSKSPKSIVPSRRSVTPSARPNVTSNETTISSIRGTSNQKTTQLSFDLNKRSNISSFATKPMNQKENASTSLALKNAGKDSNLKPPSRGVSPLVRSRVPAATITGFSDQTPPNLRTDRSTSASRGRPSNPTTTNQPKPESIKPRRQSCSPSTTRGRKMEFKQESERDATTTKGRIQAGNGTLVFGSRMVEKVMNARRLGGEERETKTKSRVSTNEGSGIGRMMSKSSLNMALKHMEIRGDAVNLHHTKTASRKNYSTSSNTSSTESSPRATNINGAPHLESWKKMENRKVPFKG